MKSIKRHDGCDAGINKTHQVNSIIGRPIHKPKRKEEKKENTLKAYTT